MKSVSPEPDRKEVGAGVFDDEVSQLKFKISILFSLAGQLNFYFWASWIILESVLYLSLSWLTSHETKNNQHRLDINILTSSNQYFSKQ